MANNESTAKTARRSYNRACDNYANGKITLDELMNAAIQLTNAGSGLGSAIDSDTGTVENGMHYETCAFPHKVEDCSPKNCGRESR
jgi:hypothetical protein